MRVAEESDRWQHLKKVICGIVRVRVEKRCMGILPHMDILLPRPTLIISIFHYTCEIVIPIENTNALHL